MPQHAVYRQATEALTQHRLKVVEAATERPATEQAAAGALPEVETQLEDGLVEEILETAQAELVLAERMLLWKPWEALEESVPEGQWVRHERK
ncbi:hypothetical protein BCR37DRAFT_379825 [Protomyces lactucae-debilis]|uniref:ETC complex I subunit conserved region-domain-containing protein n=1 Tax=Protomyces lactucae-debilis TaxID=2754530 RepID=A0A1Y2FEU1_PROLT|nr:uncharacterized protein BCR37DRAFT_379825 [Protomyces lactucae-debilis]ORY81924.1 hypothetical protein BCR37DRAFT_379825 [Protomyces lactucae-debilis]